MSDESASPAAAARAFIAALLASALMLLAAWGGTAILENENIDATETAIDAALAFAVIGMGIGSGLLLGVAAFLLVYTFQLLAKG